MTRNNLILFATILASGMAFLDGSVVSVALPKIQSDFNASLSQVAWVVNSYALTLAALLMIAGSLGDMIGRRRIFVSGIVLFTLGSILCALSPSVEFLILARAFQGIGGAIMVPGSLAIINSSINENVRGKAIGYWSGFSGGLAALGPFAGGFLTDTLGWPSIFYINVPFGILALYLTLKFVPESKNPNKTKIDFAGALLIAAALAGLTYGLMTGTSLGWGDSRVVLSLIAGAVAFIAFIYAENKVNQPLVPFEIFKSPLVTGANLVTLFLYSALYGMFFFFALYLQQVLGYSPTLAGLASLPPILIITFLSGKGGEIADKIGPRKPMILGPLAVGAGMVLIAMSGADANYFVNFLPGLILFGTGMAFVIAPLTKSALSVHTDLSGTASGVNNAVSRIAALLIIAVLGIIAVTAFSNSLNKNINKTNLGEAEKQLILIQSDKVGGIQIPDNFSDASRIQSKNAVKESFINAFTLIMGINASLAFVSSVIAYFTINYPKKKRL